MAGRSNKAGPGARAAPKRATASLRTRLARARLVCLDVDGVMTDGRIVYGPRGRDQELQYFHVQDGIAIEWLLQHGLAVVWISGRGSRTTEVRAKELGVSELHTSVKDKRAPIERLMCKHPKSIGPEQLVEEATWRMKEHRVDQIAVIDADGRPVGLLDVQDLLDVRV